MSLFVEETYWAGLDHFQDYTKDLKELVTKSDYYGIFFDAARAMAPDDKTRCCLETRLNASTGKIDDKWKTLLDENKEYPVDTEYEAAREMDTPAISPQCGQSLDDAIEVGISFFRKRNDNDGAAVRLYADLKQKARPDSREKTNWTPWLTNVRRKMKAIHA